MISPSFDIQEFISSVEDKDYLDIIFMADQEATRAERLLHHPKWAAAARENGAHNYATILEEFIFYLRYGIKPYGLNHHVFTLFRSVCKKLLEKKPVYVRC
jgi:hypothetical protein